MTQRRHIALLVIASIILSFVGCATPTALKYYDGKTLSSDEASYITSWLTDTHCDFNAIDGITEDVMYRKRKAWAWHRWQSAVQISPGHHTLKVYYYHSSDAGTPADSRVQWQSVQDLEIQFEALPGRVYYCDPQLSAGRRWNPKMREVTNANIIRFVKESPLLE